MHIYTLSDMFANLGVATAAKVTNPTGGHDRPLPAPVRPARRGGVRGPCPTRSATNRGNAYLNPLGVASSPEGAEFKILPSFDCNNAGGEREPEGTTPGCRVAEPFEYDGARHAVPAAARARLPREVVPRRRRAAVRPYAASLREIEEGAGGG